MNVQSAPAPNIHTGVSRAAMQVTVVPSKRELRRADPSLSFKVQAAGLSQFDVIVATDPTLFRPEEAHRRTPRNFRSSRQDFEGAPIEIEAGFYMLPRAFVRDAIAQEPRPTRLYYMAVAYADPTATDGAYSVPVGSFDTAPFVILGADLTASSLSRVLGMAVQRLGVVGSHGRIMMTDEAPGRAKLPRMIGGLPVSAPRRERGAPVNSVTPVGRRNGGGSGEHRGKVNSPAPVPSRDQPQQAPPEQIAPPPAPKRTSGPDTPGPVGGGFVDEDYAFASGATDHARSQGFRNFDADEDGGEGYDDGLGPMPEAGEEQGSEQWQPAPEPIPPLDETPLPQGQPAEIEEPFVEQPSPPQSQPQPEPEPGRAAPAPNAQGWKDTLVQAVIAEGVAGRYEALNLDGAFRGRMGTEHPYYQRAHDGLSIGPHQANQDSGELGKLLRRMQAADPASFAQIFGPAADEMLQVTNAEGPSSLEAPGGRSARLQPVDGQDLWEEPWVGRFRTAVAHPYYQEAMRAQIVATRLDPLLPAAHALGFDAVRGQAMLLVMAIQAGPAAAIRAARAVVNPFDTPAKLAAVLEALGYEDLPSFQLAKGLLASEVVDDASHFALLEALRGMGADAPVVLPDPETVMDSLVTSLGPGPLGDALLKLRVSGNFRQRGE